MSRVTVRLRTLAAVIVNRRTMERVIEPLLTDLQLEYEVALRHGRRWRSRWALVAGCIAFVKTLTLCVAWQVVVGDRVRTMDDGAALKRMAWISTAAMMVATTLLVYSVLAKQARQPGILSRHPEVLLMLVPQALALAIPIGVTFGVIIGLRGRAISPRLWRKVTAYSVGCCLAGFVTITWLLPTANQTFREVIFQSEFTDASGTDSRKVERPLLEKGVTELTLGELRTRMSMVRSDGSASSDDARLVIYFHQIWALSFASLVLAVFGLSISRHFLSRWTSALSGVGTIVGYYVLLWVGQSTARLSLIPAAAGAWLPNVVLAIAALAIFITTLRTPETLSANES